MEEKVSISISKETHNRLKQHCDKHSFKIQGWVDMVIREKLDKLHSHNLEK